MSDQQENVPQHSEEMNIDHELSPPRGVDENRNSEGGTKNPPTAPNIDSEQQVPLKSSTVKQKHGLNKELCNLQSSNIPGLSESFNINSTRRRRPSYQQLLPMFQDVWEDAKELIEEYRKRGFHNPTPLQITRLKNLYASLKEKRGSLKNMGQKLCEVLYDQGAPHEINNIEFCIQELESTMTNIKLSHPNDLDETASLDDQFSQQRPANNTRQQCEVILQNMIPPNQIADIDEELRNDIQRNVAVTQTSNTEWTPDSNPETYFLIPQQSQQTQASQVTIHNPPSLPARENQPGRTLPTS